MTHWIGYSLIMISFLWGALLTSLDQTRVNWPWFILALLVGFCGLFLVKKAQISAARADHKLDEDIKLMRTSLDNIVVQLTSLNRTKQSLPTYEARFEIDKRVRDDLDNFAEVRNSMRHVFGLQNYADIMSAFAAGERYVNRVWSASTDGYVDEVRNYLEKSLDQFVEAKQKFVQQQERRP